MSSCITRREEANIAPPEPRHEVIQLGDTAIVLRGPYKSVEALIEWMDASGTQVWIYVQEKDEPNTDADDSSGSKAGVRNYLERDLEQQVKSIMVTVNVHDIRVQQPTNTLSLSKERGYDVCAGDSVDVARGEWFRSRGVVQRVYFDKGNLDLVCEADGRRVSIVCQLFCGCTYDLFRSLFQLPFAARFESAWTRSYRSGSAAMSGWLAVRRRAIERR